MFNEVQDKFLLVLPRVFLFRVLWCTCKSDSLQSWHLVKWVLLSLVPDRENCLCLCSAIPPSLPKDISTHSWSVQQKGNSISGFNAYNNVYYSTVIFFSSVNKGLHSCSEEGLVWMGWEWQVWLNFVRPVCAAGTNTQDPETFHELCKEELSTSVTHHTGKNGEESLGISTPSFGGEQSLWWSTRTSRKAWKGNLLCFTTALRSKKKKRSWTGYGERAVNKLVSVMGI